MVFKLTTRQRGIYQLAIADWVISTMKDSEYYPQLNHAIDTCWTWMKTHELSGDEIYHLIDDGTEFGGIFIYIQMDDSSENKPKWNCILEACSFVATMAYKNEGEIYLPEMLEGLTEDNATFFDSEVQKLVLNDSEFIFEIQGFIINQSSENREEILNKVKEFSSKS